MTAADPADEPIHTRSHGAVVSLRTDGKLDARGALLDLRTRGFLPVGGSLQGMGIIHHMELAWVVDPVSGVIEDFTPAQPTVAFEATPETGGESCRDPIAAVMQLAGARLGAGFASLLRERIGGALGCSHLITLASFMEAAVRAGLADQRTLAPARLATPQPGTLFRRDLVFDAREQRDGQVVVRMRGGDLHWNDAPPTALAPARFASLHELAATLTADLWPGTLQAITGRERRRTAAAFAAVPWIDRTVALQGLGGLGLARGVATEIMTRLGDDSTLAPWIDALLMLAPALVQCRAAHPDAWHEKVRATERHPGLTAIPDSCYMWRRGGALEQRRQAHGAVKGGR